MLCPGVAFTRLRPSCGALRTACSSQPRCEAWTSRPPDESCWSASSRSTPYLAPDDWFLCHYFSTDRTTALLLAYIC
jgi:hypothetical protein